MRAFVQLYLAAVREFVRDLTAVFWNLAFPIMFMLILGVIYGSEDGGRRFGIGIVNEDGAPSDALVRGFEQIEAFAVTVGVLEEELQALDEGDRDAVIVIPAGAGAKLATRLAADIATGDSIPLVVYTDPADVQTSQIVLAVMERVMSEMAAAVTGRAPVFTVEARATTANNFRYIDYLVPGVLALSLLQLGTYGTAEPLVGLREKGVLRRMGATPLTKTVMLASQVAFRLTLALITTGLIAIVGALVFEVHIEWANTLAIIGVVALGGTLFIVMGYVLSGLSRTEQAVQGVVALPYFVFMFLSGIFFPLGDMPGWIRPLVDVIPLTYLGDALRAVMIETGTSFSMARNLAIMAGWLVVCAVLAVRVFKWEPQA